MSKRIVRRVIAPALVLGLMPSINILWELLHNRLPIGWWWMTRMSGWPSFALLRAVFGYWWVPTNVADMPLSTHLIRWAVFLFLNVILWGALFFAVDMAKRSLRPSARRRG